MPIVAVRPELCSVSKVFLPCVGHKFLIVYSRTRRWLLSSNVAAAATTDLSDLVVHSMKSVSGEVLISVLSLQ